MSPFEKALAFVLEREGGYVDDPKDRGGETNYGISKKSYPNEDIKGMTRERAAIIYERDFWDACKCGQLPIPIAFVVFDIAVNQGQPTACFLLQEALGVTQDGIIGSVTIQNAGRANVRTTLAWLTSLRCDRYSKAKDVHVYGKGWFRRAALCLMFAMESLNEFSS